MQVFLSVSNFQRRKKAELRLEIFSTLQGGGVPQGVLKPCQHQGRRLWAHLGVMTITVVAFVASVRLGPHRRGSPGGLMRPSADRTPVLPEEPQASGSEMA